MSGVSLVPVCSKSVLSHSGAISVGSVRVGAQQQRSAVLSVSAQCHPAVLLVPSRCPWVPLSPSPTTAPHPLSARRFYHHICSSIVGFHVFFFPPLHPSIQDAVSPPCPPPARTQQRSVHHRSSLRLPTFPLLLPLLELPQPPCPRVPPLDHQAALVRDDAALVWRVLGAAQQEVLLHGFHLGALAGDVLGVHPQGLIPTPQPVAALFVDGDDVDGELPPVGIFFRFQDVDLHSWKRRRERRKAVMCELQRGERAQPHPPHTLHSPPLLTAAPHPALRSPAPHTAHSPP